MLPRLFLALLIMTAIFYIVSKIKKGSKKQNRKFIFQLFFWIAIIIVILAVITGRMHWLGIPIAALFTAIKFGSTYIVRFLPFLKFLTQHMGQPSFQTEFLAMQLDISTGQLTGKILKGTYDGKILQELTAEELNTLLAEYKSQDNRSYYLLKAFMLRRQGPQADTHTEQNYASSVNNFTVEEAFKILGLEAGASKDEVIKHHKLLMQKIHPDRGGNDFLASQVNRAKEILMDTFK